MRYYLLLALLFVLNVGFNQNSVGIGMRIKKSDMTYYYGISTNQSNIDYVKPSYEFVGFKTYYNTSNTNKILFGYTLEVGVCTFKFNETRVYLPTNPYWESDTIGSIHSKSYKGRKVNITNYLDFRIRINKKVTFINSLGFKIQNREGFKAIKNSGKSSLIFENDNYVDYFSDKRKNINVYNYQNRFPLNFKFVFIPQLQISFNSYQFRIQLYQDFFNINKWIKPIDIGGVNYTNFTGVGIVIETNNVLSFRQHYILE